MQWVIPEIEPNLVGVYFGYDDYSERKASYQALRISEIVYPNLMAKETFNRQEKMDFLLATDSPNGYGSPDGMVCALFKPGTTLEDAKCKMAVMTGYHRCLTDMGLSCRSAYEATIKNFKWIQ